MKIREIISCGMFALGVSSCVAGLIFAIIQHVHHDRLASMYAVGGLLIFKGLAGIGILIDK